MTKRVYSRFIFRIFIISTLRLIPDRYSISNITGRLYRTIFIRSVDIVIIITYVPFGMTCRNTRHRLGRWRYGDALIVAMTMMTMTSIRYQRRRGNTIIIIIIRWRNNRRRSTNGTEVRVWLHPAHVSEWKYSGRLVVRPRHGGGSEGSSGGGTMWLTRDSRGKTDLDAPRGPVVVVVGQQRGEKQNGSTDTAQTAAEVLAKGKFSQLLWCRVWRERRRSTKTARRRRNKK